MIRFRGKEEKKKEKSTHRNNTKFILVLLQNCTLRSEFLKKDDVHCTGKAILDNQLTQPDHSWVMSASINNKNDDYRGYII